MQPWEFLHVLIKPNQYESEMLSLYNILWVSGRGVL